MKRITIALSCLWLLVGCTFQSNVIHVTLVNTGATEARNIEVRYPGATFGVASLPPGKTFEYRVKPFHDGLVEIEYLAGEQRVKVTLARVREGQAGRARVTLRDDGANWEELPAP